MHPLPKQILQTVHVYCGSKPQNL